MPSGLWTMQSNVEKLSLSTDSFICSFAFSCPLNLPKDTTLLEKQSPAKELHGSANRSFEKHPKSHSCNQCSYACKKPSKLKRHILVHSGERPFACIQCNYSSKQSADLKRHMFGHSGEKPFSCLQCSYSCTTSSDLKKHIRTHTGEKPFNCFQCDYTSTTPTPH